MTGINQSYLIMFGKSFFEVLSLFFIGTITFYCCKSNSKESRTELNRKGGTSKLNRVIGVKSKTVETKKEDGFVTATTQCVNHQTPTTNPTMTTSKFVGNSKKNNRKEGVSQKHPPKNEPIGETPQNILPPDDFLPFQKTMYENVHNPAVHDRALKIAAEGLIVDPRQTTYGGNIDMALEREKQQRFAKFQKELANADQQITESSVKKSENGRVKIREDKCILFETNEVPTEDEEEENNDVV